MPDTPNFRFQLIVFALVSAALTNIYVTQPVLPILQDVFSADMVLVSFSVSALILGIALANLPFGLLADRYPIQPIILTGGLAVGAAGLVCAATSSIWILIGARFVQGLFVPSMTTCLAAYLAKTLPMKRLNVVMGSYVSATVLGGLGGRLLGGWLHSPSNWRHAFISAAILTLLATLIAMWGLPKTPGHSGRVEASIGFIEILKRRRIMRMFLCAMGSFAIFSSVFNYLPYRLTAPPFGLSTEMATLLYLAYVVGIFIGPIAGQIGNRFGSGNALLVGTMAVSMALILLLLSAIIAVIFGLIAICAGFFTIHAAAVGALNRMLDNGQGRANALYVMFYYLGGWLGITMTGMAYKMGGWFMLVCLCGLLLAIPFTVGIGERNHHIQQ